MQSFSSRQSTIKWNHRLAFGIYQAWNDDDDDDDDDDDVDVDGDDDDLKKSSQIPVAANPIQPVPVILSSQKFFLKLALSFAL